MTLDEAIKHCEKVASRCTTNRFCAEEHRQLAEWLKELKAYKGQQPCEDCISREMAMKECYTIHDDYGERFDVVQLETLEGLPPVTPANVYIKGYKDAMEIHEKLKVEHKGKWIVWTDDRKDYAKCSCCGYGEEGEVLWKDTTKYCPNCGADMRGEEE